MGKTFLRQILKRNWVKIVLYVKNVKRWATEDIVHCVTKGFVHLLLPSPFSATLVKSKFMFILYIFFDNSLKICEGFSKGLLRFKLLKDLWIREKVSATSRLPLSRRVWKVTLIWRSLSYSTWKRRHPLFVMWVFVKVILVVSNHVRHMRPTELLKKLKHQLYNRHMIRWNQSSLIVEPTMQVWNVDSTLAWTPGKFSIFNS